MVIKKKAERKDIARLVFVITTSNTGARNKPGFYADFTTTFRKRYQSVFLLKQPVLLAKCPHKLGSISKSNTARS